MNTEITEALHARADAVPHSPMPRLGQATRRRWPVPVAAAVAVVAAVGAVVVALSGNDAPDKVATPPPATGLAPGEVYYTLRLTDIGAGHYFRETQLWQPPDRAGEWRQQVVGGQSIKDGRVVPGGRLDAPPGGVCYPATTATDKSCTAPGSWFNPTVDFVASAPRDPATIAEQLHAAALDVLRQNGQGEDLAPMLELNRIGELLAGNGVPPELSAALRQVAAGLPGVTVTENTANLAGETGTGYSLPHPSAGTVTVIFDRDDHYIGSPTESVHHGIAPGLGRPPSRMLN